MARSSGVRPAVSRLLRHGSLHVADRLQHVGPGPRRPLIRHPVDDVGDEQRLGRVRRRLRLRRCWRRAGRRSSRRRRLRSATVSPDRRHRCPSCGDRVSADASRVSAARSQRDGSRPSRWRKSSSLSASASSMSPVRFENTSSSSSGTPAISACPLTIGRQSTPKRCGQLGPQDRLVEAAEHPLVPLQVAGVERQPATVGGLDLGGDHGVGVDLRVIGPRRRLTERRHRQPAACPGAAGAPFERIRVVDPNRSRCVERRGDGDVVRLEQPAVAGQRPPHRQRLRRRERRVEPGHRPHAPARRSWTGRRARVRAVSRSPGHGPTAAPRAARP